MSYCKGLFVTTEGITVSIKTCKAVLTSFRVSLLVSILSFKSEVMDSSVLGMFKYFF